MLRTRGDAKIDWDEVGWRLAVAPAKIRKGVKVSNLRKVRIWTFMFIKIGQRRDVLESHTSNIATLRCNVATFQRIRLPMFQC